ncbi:unnamed protein product [Onchocerca flexuosa]|uniref:Uncharacterized protein n=1 Tax=Onchocerca flexuosa TaxID=387005 RepID=A0A183HSU1_9BILA|nr:unnamed protein product [Onchocerca flexuosa]
MVYMWGGICARTRNLCSKIYCFDPGTFLLVIFAKIYFQILSNKTFLKLMQLFLINKN